MGLVGLPVVGLLCWALMNSADAELTIYCTAVVLLNVSFFAVEVRQMDFWYRYFEKPR